MIFELVVYDGSQKVFRVLNLNTGTVYSCEHESYGAAFTSIDDGAERAGNIVKAVTLEQIHRLLSNSH